MKKVYVMKFTMLMVAACWAMLLPTAGFSQQKKMDWSQPELISVQVKVGKNKVELTAGGQRIVFNGELFKLNAGLLYVLYPFK